MEYSNENLQFILIKKKYSKYKSNKTACHNVVKLNEVPPRKNNAGVRPVCPRKNNFTS